MTRTGADHSRHLGHRLTGSALGSMYGLIALGFHVTYVVSNTVNFSQGSSVMLGAVLGYIVLPCALGWPLPLACRRGPRCCAPPSACWWSATLVRPFASRGSNAWLMATVAGGIVLDNAVLFTFGKEPRSFPPLLSDEQPIELFGAGVYPLQIADPRGRPGACGRRCLCSSQRTRHGKALLAVVQNADAARLMGIDVTRVDRARPTRCRPLSPASPAS